PRRLAAPAPREPGLQPAQLLLKELEMRALFVGELEEDALALRVFEAFAVALEEAMRPALARDADAQRLFVVHAGAQLVEPFGEEPAGRSFEEEKRRP